MVVREEYKTLMTTLSINWQNNKALQASFLLNTLGMVINNVGLLVVWLIFINTFGAINGWGIISTIGLHAYINIIYGLTFTFGSGAISLAEYIDQGTLDAFLVRPKSLYLRIISSEMSVSALGDIIEGLVLFIIFIFWGRLSIVQIGLALSLIIPATLVILNFRLIASSLLFWIPNGSMVSSAMFELLLGPSLMPAGVFQGSLRFVMSFIIPALIIGGIPVEVVTGMNIKGASIVWLIGVFWTIIAIIVLKLGLKRYESGSLVGSR